MRIVELTESTKKNLLKDLLKALPATELMNRRFPRL